MSPPGHAAGEAVAAALPEVDHAGHEVRVSVLTRRGCHLCDKALATVATVATQVEPAVGYAAVDIDELESQARAEVVRRYGDWLPVTFVDGRQHDYWVVDADRLREVLAGPGSRP